MSSPLQRPVLYLDGRPIHGIIFDMDGVIADTFEAHRESWGAYFRHEGLDIDPEEFLRRSFGQGKNENMAMIYGEGLTQEFIDEKAELKEAFFIDLFRAGGVRPVKGVIDFIAALGRIGFPVAVGTSAPLGNLNTTLEIFGIKDAFRAWATVEDVKRTKPAPDIFLIAAERLGVPPEECLVFEDSKHGLRAARAAGMAVLCVTTTHTPEEVTGMCDGCIADFCTAMELLGRGGEAARTQ